MNPVRHRRRFNGSAVAELLAIIPFALVLMAAVVDLRSFAAHRLDIAREFYTVAEVVANSASWPSATAQTALRKTVNAAVNRLRGNTSGWMRVAVVARPRDNPGDSTAVPPVPATQARNSDNNLCNPATNPPFCEPEVLREVDFDPVASGTQYAEWGGGTSDGNSCSDITPRMPVEGNQFAREAVVLPNEDADPDGDGPEAAPASSDWISRNLESDAWWVVVEICTHFGGGTSTPGLFAGGMAGFAMEAFDASAAGARLQRVAWGALDPLDDCAWCGAIGAAAP